jgi:uncharacterized membrane protein YphA (DoxX/SURF4 family)
MTRSGSAKAAVFWTATALLAVRLFLPAAALSFFAGPKAEFEQTGLPGWLRCLLAWPEMIGSVLLIIPFAFEWGAAILALDLCGAIAVHVRLGTGAGALYILLGLLGILCLVRRRVLSAGLP